MITKNVIDANGFLRELPGHIRCFLGLDVNEVRRHHMYRRHQTKLP